jgi:hypothetical protein
VGRSPPRLTDALRQRDSMSWVYLSAYSCRSIRVYTVKYWDTTQNPTHTFASTSRLGGRLRFINSTGSVNAGMSNGYQCI